MIAFVRTSARLLTPALVALALAGCQHELTGTAPVAQGAAAVPGIDRQQAEAHLNLARTLEEAGDLAGALADYQVALAYDGWAATPDAEPGAGTPFAGLARLCESGGPDEVVIVACAEAVNIGRFPPERLSGFLLRRGDANMRLGELRRAEADYGSALALDSANAAVPVARGRLYETAGQDIAAEREYSLALLRWPDLAPARLARGRLRARLGDIEGAIEDFDAVLSDPVSHDAHPEAYGDRALAHCRSGQPEAAAVDWQVWQALDPEATGLTRELLGAGADAEGLAASDPALAESLAGWIAEGCPDQP